MGWFPYASQPSKRDGFSLLRYSKLGVVHPIAVTAETRVDLEASGRRTDRAAPAKTRRSPRSKRPFVLLLLLFQPNGWELPPLTWKTTQ